jgi:hypothetical protein
MSILTIHRAPLVALPTERLALLVSAIAIEIDAELYSCAAEYYRECQHDDCDAGLLAGTAHDLARAQVAYDMARTGIVWSLAQSFPVAFDPWTTGCPACGADEITSNGASWGCPTCTAPGYWATQF